MNKPLIGIVGAVLLVIVLFGSGALYVVDETEQVVVTRFGKPVGKAVLNAGLHFKMPFIDVKNTFEKRILQWDGEPGDAIPTGDKKRISIDTFGRWRIVDPLKFFEQLTNEREAKPRIDDIIDGATKNVIAGTPLIEIVRNSTRTFETSEFGVEVTDQEIVKPIKKGREKIAQAILKTAAPELKHFGIVLEDVQIKRINYVESVRKTVFNRMISERRRAAEKLRSEGRGEHAKIEGTRQRDLLVIQSEAQRKAQEVRGKADREALNILARAYNRDPSFFAFYQTLQTYADSIKDNTQFIFSTDNDYIKYLKKINP